MAERLIVENFGPIKKIDIDLSRVMIFIGPQSVGKSTIAKLVAIFRNGLFVFEQEKFEDSLTRYGIETYVKIDTEIRYECNPYTFAFKDGICEKKENQSHPFHNSMKSFYNSEKSNPWSAIDKHEKKIQAELKKISIIQEQIEKNIKKKSEFDGNNEKINEVEKRLNVLQEVTNLLETRMKKKDELLIEAQKYICYGVYFPAERSLLPIISNSIMNLIENEVPIPKILIGFASMFEKARQKIKEYNINFLGVKFIHTENESRLYTSNKDYFKLNNPSSGLQSIIPMLLVIENIMTFNSNTYECSSFIIEEPELNLYPKNQYELSKILAAVCFKKNEHTKRHNELIITTHSPYILAAFNNFLLAHNIGTENKEEVSKVIPEKSWVDPEHFKAYYIDEKGIIDIFNEKTGLISENHLDQTSEIMMDDFNDLMDLYASKVY